jgi:hypothetical protein
MNDFAKKLQDHFITILVGALIGFPALSTLIPNIFSAVAEAQALKKNSALIFELFSIIYFSTPLLIVLIILTFKLGNSRNPEVSKRFRKLRYQLCSGFFIFVSSVVVLHILHDDLAILKSMNNDAFLLIIVAFCIVNVIFFFFWYDDAVKDNIFHFDDKSVILFGFINVTYNISLITSSFSFAYDHIRYLFGICISIYLAMLLPIRKLSKDDKFARVIVLTIALLVVLPIGIILNSGSTSTVKDKSESHECFERSFQKLLEIDAINKRLDSLEYFEAQKNAQGFLSSVAADSISSVYRAFSMTEPPRSAPISPISSKALAAIKHSLVSERKALMLDAREHLYVVIKQIKYHGILTFICFLLVLSTFFYLLKARDAGDLLENTLIRCEMVEVRRVLRVAVTVIAGMLILLLKPVDKSEINPEKIGSLFHVDNWNLFHGGSEAKPEHTQEKP